MLSRVANSLFWLARYLERAESSARFLAVTHDYSQELRGVLHGAAEECWRVAQSLLMVEPEAGEPLAAVFRRQLLDPELPSSLLSSVARARENARGIRDSIPSELWQELNVLYLGLQEDAAAELTESAQLALLVRVRRTAHVCQGLRDHTMVRGDQWHFLQLGQYVERADVTARILRAMFTHPALQAAQEIGHSIDAMHLTATLRACTGLEAYSRLGPGLSVNGVAEFLLLEGRFARSVEFCVQEIGRSLHALSGTPGDVFSNEAEQLAGRLLAELRFSSIDEVMLSGFREYMDQLLEKLHALGHGIGREYFR
jgi:uncharacterized alpha-E superfamily protein